MLDKNNTSENALTNERTNERTVYHCFFEQSGTFKNEFRKLGYDAYDYDILDDFGQTDFVIDLFAEIEKAYDGQESVFDSIKKNDVILAFFPCVRFENQIMLSFRGQAKQFKNWSMKDKMLYDMRLMKELKHNYDVVNKMFIVCMDRGMQLVMENPYSEEHFLRRYWCYPATIIDKDRRDSGDYFQKPTQFWFLNIQPKQNLVFEAVTYNNIESTGNGKDSWQRRTNKDLMKTGAKSFRVARSMIHPQYANRFIRQYILDGEIQTEKTGQLSIFDIMKEGD